MSGLPRKKADNPRPDEGLNGGSRLTVLGAIRPPGEIHALEVELTVDEFEISLRAGRAEIGNWLTSMVSIRRIDNTSFEFAAEGDQLIFTPDDPVSFAAHPVVAASETKKERRRREKEEAKAARKSARESKEAADEEKRAAKEAEKAARVAKKAEAREAKRSSRKAAAEESGLHEVKVDEDPQLAEPPPTSFEERSAAIAGATAEDSAQMERTASNVSTQEDASLVEADDQELPDEPSKEPEADINRLWIRAIDVARKYDLLGLDRVPIDESLRGQEHEHTWEHRVAWKSGIGANVCTICGKIRRKADQPATSDFSGSDE